MNTSLPDTGTSLSIVPTPTPEAAAQRPTLPRLEPIEAPPPGSNPEDVNYGGEIEIPPDLPPEVKLVRRRQRIVLELMLRGYSIKFIAEATNVARMTIHRWLKSDPAFRAALEAWEERVDASARNKLRAAAERAAEVVVEKSNAGDLRAALAVLRGTGVLKPEVEKAVEMEKPQERARPARGGKRLEMRLRELLLSMQEPPEQEDQSESPKVLSGGAELIAEVPQQG